MELGRFADEKIANGTILAEKLCYFVKDCSKPHLVKNSGVFDETLQIPYNAVLTFTSGEDIEKYIGWVVATGVPREEIVEVLVHFIHGFGGNLTLCNASTQETNHSATPCTQVTLRETADGVRYTAVQAIRDIEVGEEFLQDYAEYQIPDYALTDFFKKNNVPDARSICAEACNDEERFAKARAEFTFAE